jgi:hypothetical protein
MDLGVSVLSIHTGEQQQFWTSTQVLLIWIGPEDDVLGFP